MKATEEIRDLPFFFIIGRARSGTSLLRILFDAHSSVNIPFECPYILNLFPKYGKIKSWTESDILSYLSDLKNVRKYNLWDVNQEKLKNDLLSCKGETYYENIVKIVHNNFQSLFNKGEIKMLGDKNPIYSMHVNKLIKIFPEAKFLHVTRDYRDHINSMLRNQLGRGNIPLISYRWRYSQKLIISLKNKQPSQFYTIRYEDLVSKPENKLKEICSFLKIDYEPSILEFHKSKEKFINKFTKEVIDKHHKSLFSPISKKNIYLWKSALHERDIRLADMIVGKYAELSGYERKYKKVDKILFIRFLPRLLKIWLSFKLRFLFKNSHVN